MLTEPRHLPRSSRDEAWRRLKSRTDKPRFLAILREVAAWREDEAQRRDLPRNRVLRDETLCEIAAHAPSDVEDLGPLPRARSRLSPRAGRGPQILAAVERGLAAAGERMPEPDRRAATCPRASAR